MATVKLIAGTRTGWDVRDPVPPARVGDIWQVAGPRDNPLRSPWSTPGDLGSRLRATWNIVWLETGTADARTRLPYGAAGTVEPARIRPSWTSLMVYVDQPTRAAWGPYPGQHHADVAAPWGAPAERDIERASLWGLYAAHPDRNITVTWSEPGKAATTFQIPWGKGIKPWAPRGTHIIDVNLPPPPSGTALRTVPNLLVYYQMNIATVSRLPERTPLNFKSLRISVDVDSFAPRWTGTLDAASYELIKPNGPNRYKIEATINGHVWHLLVEKPGHSQKFGRGDYQVSGRGQVAELAPPHTPPRSYTNPFDRNMNQLADEELTNTGWSVNWSTEWWLVPAGVWAYEELSPIQAIARLANAAGAVVLSDESLKELTVKPRYPISPWFWISAQPDWSIPMAAAYSLSSDWEEKPLYNAVIVSGENQGVLCNVVRQGTAGDVQAPMVIDPLITHQDGGRERGRVVLSDHGVQSLETLEIPLRAYPAEPGLVRPLELVVYSDAGGSWRGLCVGSVVSVEWGRASLNIKQTVQLERHHDD